MNPRVHNPVDDALARAVIAILANHAVLKENDAQALVGPSGDRLRKYV
jgi:hypothetical protein